jgi:hypothetical protein
LLAVGLAFISFNSTLPSPQYALFWGGAITANRGVALLLPWAGLAIGIPMLFACFLGLEVGGLIVAPSVMVFLVADVVNP